MRFCTFAFSAALTLIGVKNGWKMHEKEKKEVLSSANYVFALKPHLLQMEYIFSALRMLLCLLRQLPLNVTALAKVYIFSVSLTSFLVRKGLKMVFVGLLSWHMTSLRVLMNNRRRSTMYMDIVTHRNTTMMIFGTIKG